ncbi:hypothetical protein J1605_002350 [Eschrichtius robustus]|uniref:Uncharacterized protein n=1 Tax=Eschrichtius robustus TaxID=9764 RepID=A0AB34HTT2_ESCRO|nr:hypothetical protein J1605_002350 [Eschrichtius robustus]
MMCRPRDSAEEETPLGADRGESHVWGLGEWEVDLGLRTGGGGGGGRGSSRCQPPVACPGACQGLASAVRRQEETGPGPGMRLELVLCGQPPGPVPRRSARHQSLVPRGLRGSRGGRCVPGETPGPAASPPAFSSALKWGVEPAENRAVEPPQLSGVWSRQTWPPGASGLRARCPGDTAALARALWGAVLSAVVGKASFAVLGVTAVGRVGESWHSRTPSRGGPRGPQRRLTVQAGPQP